jgi:hypothetical protein
MPVDVNVDFPSGDTTLVIWDSLAVQSFTLVVDGEPSAVELDKDEWILRTTQEVATAIQGSTPTTSFSLRQNYPNPFNPGTTIQFTLANPAETALRIFDTSGRLVRTLVDNRLAAGPHSVIWNGDNHRGRAVASGVYFYRLESGGSLATKKMVLLR